MGEDGPWWVVRLPTEIAGDGYGWVNASYVTVTSAEDVPVVSTPPSPLIWSFGQVVAGFVWF